MRITKLMKNNKCDFPVKEIGKFDPYIEYFALNEEIKKCYLLRSFDGDNLMLINLSYASPTSTKLISKENFEDLCEEYILLQLPHYAGENPAETREIENKARKDMYKYLIENGYFEI